MRREEVPENLANKMSEADRKALGLVTQAEAFAKEIKRNEKAEHQTYINWLQLNRIPFRTDRMDRRVSGSVGWPDFLVVYGSRCLPVELKVYGNKLSADQVRVRDDLARTGTEVLVCYSADEAIRRTRGWLWEHWKLAADGE